jgi:hypothetical protein
MATDNVRSCLFLRIFSLHYSATTGGAAAASAAGLAEVAAPMASPESPSAAGVGVGVESASVEGSAAEMGTDGGLLGPRLTPWCPFNSATSGGLVVLVASTLVGTAFFTFSLSAKGTRFEAADGGGGGDDGDAGVFLAGREGGGPLAPVRGGAAVLPFVLMAPTPAPRLELLLDDDAAAAAGCSLPIFSPPHAWESMPNRFPPTIIVD